MITTKVPQVKLFSSVFLGELKAPKKHSGINSPLIYIKNVHQSNSNCNKAAFSEEVVKC